MSDSKGHAAGLQKVGQQPGETRTRRWARLSTQVAPTYIMLSPFLLLAVLPFLIILLTAFKTSDEIPLGVFHLPNVWRWHNFAAAWTQGHFGDFFRSSIIVAVAVLAVATPLSVMTGYAFGCMRFPLRQLLFYVFLLGLMLPLEGYIIPLYYNMLRIGLWDTYWALILPEIAWFVCFGTFWMRGFFAGVPRELVDAAKVDGCSSWDTLWKVLLPVARPAIMTMVVLFFVWSWNEFLPVLVLVQRDELRTLPVGLSLFQGQWTRDVPLTSAAASIVALPTILIYLIFQRQFIRGITAGSVTGV